jgi:hypothetical protein
MWCEEEVPKWTIRLLGTCADWLATDYDLRHTITLNVPASGYLIIGDETKRCYGMFGYLNKATDVPIIWIAGYWYYWKGTLADNRAEASAFLLDTLIHEFVHYEQWRDGKAFSHRGLDRRVDSLVRRFYDAHQEFTPSVV